MLNIGKAIMSGLTRIWRMVASQPFPCPQCKAKGGLCSECEDERRFLQTW